MPLIPMEVHICIFNNAFRSTFRFLRLFRLSKPAVKYLIDELENVLPIRSRSTSIPNSVKIAAMLRYCAHGSYQGSVGQDFLVGMSQSTVSKILTDIFSGIENNMCRKWVSFRQSEREKELAAEQFYQKTGFPGVIGCVDGTHINIVRPIENEHLFFNRKGKHSINTMIVSIDTYIILKLEYICKLF